MKLNLPSYKVFFSTVFTHAPGLVFVYFSKTPVNFISIIDTCGSTQYDNDIER